MKKLSLIVGNFLFFNILSAHSIEIVDKKKQSDGVKKESSNLLEQPFDESKLKQSTIMFSVSIIFILCMVYFIYKKYNKNNDVSNDNSNDNSFYQEPDINEDFDRNESPITHVSNDNSNDNSFYQEPDINEDFDRNESPITLKDLFLMEDKIENLANLTPEERENLDKYENFLLKRNSIYFYIFIHGIKKIETILDLIKDKNKKQKFLNKCLNIKSLTIEIRDSILNIDTLKKQEYFSTLKTFINQLFEDEEIKKIIETDKKEYNSVSLLYQMLNNSLDIIFNNENSYLDSSYEKYIIQSILMEKIIKKVFNTKNKKIEFTQNGYNFSLEKKKDSWEKYPIIIKISSPKYKIEIELKNNNFHLSTSDLHGYNDNFKTAMAMYLNEFNNIKKANNETIINDMKSLSLKITKDHLNKEIKSIRTEIFLSSNIRFLSRILNKIIKIEK